MIVCSANLYIEPISVEECLHCARSHHEGGMIPPCNMVYPLLRAIYGSQEDRRDEVHVTDLGKCLLSAYLDKVDPTPVAAIDMIRLFVGIAVHELIEKSTGYGLSEVSGEKDGISYRIDWMIPEMIVDFKSTMFLSHGKEIRPSEERQLNAYRQLVNPDASMFIQYLDVYGVWGVDKKKKNQPPHPGVMCVKIEKVDSELSERASVLANALKTRKEPIAEPGNGCNFCSHINRCDMWREKE